MRSRWQKAVVTLVLALAGSLVLAPSVFAHAKYETSNPADESSVAAPPSEVWAEYSEPPTQESWLQVYDPCGERVDSGSYSYFGKRITTSMSSDKAGTYTVLWRVVSDLDSHPTSGEFTFTVTDGDSCPSSGDGQPSEKDEAKRSGSKSQDGSETATAGSQGDDAQAAASEETVASDDNSDKESKKKKKGKKHRHHRKMDRSEDPDSRSVELVASGPTSQDPPGDIPTGWLLISFGIAAVIGAAAGQIYVNIVDGE